LWSDWAQQGHARNKNDNFTFILKPWTSGAAVKFQTAVNILQARSTRGFGDNPKVELFTSATGQKGKIPLVEKTDLQVHFLLKILT